MMTSVGEAILNLIFFPGFVFTAVVGLLVSWIDRKISARIQWRKGPPWYQPFADIIKLLGKEIILPGGRKRSVFLLAPLLALAGVTLVSTIVWKANLSSSLLDEGFVGDLIVVLYLLTLPSLAIIIGGSASGNPYASVGASREIKLLLGYELPFLLAILTLVVKTGGGIEFSRILAFQQQGRPLVGYFSGVIAFIVAIISSQAKLGLVPFDIAEAETEINSGPMIEYSGAPLAVFRISKAMLLFVLPVFLVTVFWGGMVFDAWETAIYSVIKYLVILIIMILIKNTNPRLRIDQALKFLWGPLTGLALVGLVLSIVGV